MRPGAIVFGSCVIAIATGACAEDATTSHASPTANAKVPAQSAKDAPPSKIQLVDVADTAGLTTVQISGDPRRWYIPESNGTGAAWLDYDGDGDMDLFVGNGQGMRYVDDGARLEVVRTGRSALYRNDGHMHFTDVSEATGCARSDWMQAIATGDVDNDGDPDLYIACFGPHVFLRNDGGKFVDATKDAGLGCELWGAGAAFADVDRDGALDLYVANYCVFDLAHPPLGGKREVIDGVEVGWGPEAENKQGFNVGAPDLFYFGDGHGHFLEATRGTGLALEKPLCSYAVVFSDVDDDGWQDILVANDGQPANLFINDGKGHFADKALERGFAFNAEGKATASMGMTVEDFDGDGDMDVLRTNFDLEANSLLVNDGKGHFQDLAMLHGLAQPSVDKLGWACAFFDVECDGDLDLLVANGHVYPQAKEIGMSSWLMPTQLYEAVADPKCTISYRDVTAEVGGGLATLHSARGIALADADDDGDLDVVVIDLDEKPRLLENRSVRAGHWISVRCRGIASNRDGIGARVSVVAGGRVRVREMRTTQGLYSSHDPRLFFGLGDVKAIERVEVQWPNGAHSELAAPKLDALLEISEPADPRGSRPIERPQPKTTR
jgi:hypothetical protein